MGNQNNDFENIQYQEAGNMMRTYINLRFAQLTLFFGIIYFIGTQILPPGLEIAGSNLWVWAGLIITFLFKILEHRAADYYHYYRKWTLKLELKLKTSSLFPDPFNDEVELPDYGFWSHFNATWAVGMLFNILIVTWIYLLVTNWESDVNLPILILAMALLVLHFVDGHWVWSRKDKGS